MKFFQLHEVANPLQKLNTRIVQCVSQINNRYMYPPVCTNFYPKLRELLLIQIYSNVMHTCIARIALTTSFRYV